MSSSILQWWLRILGTVFSVALTIPATWATYECYANGRLCNYAIIGPDEKTTTQRNRQTLEQDGSNPNAVLAFKVDRIDNLLSNRLDIYAARSDGKELIIDSIPLRGSTNAQTDTSRNWALVTYSRVENRYSQLQNETSTILLYLGDERIVSRKITILCSSLRGASNIEVRNAAYNPEERNIKFDILTTCSSVTVNGVKQEVYSHGDIWTISLDTEFHVAGIDARKKKLKEISDAENAEKKRKADEATELEKAKKSAREKKQEVRMSEVVDTLTKCRDAKLDSKPARSKIVACSELDHSVMNWGDRTNYASDAAIGAYSTDGAIKKLWWGCFGPSGSEFDVSHESTSAVGVCYEEVGSYKGDSGYSYFDVEKLNIEISVYNATDTKNLIEADILCDCRSASLEDLTFDAETRRIEFTVKANTNQVRFDGRDYQLSGKFEGDKTVGNGRDKQAFNHGRYRIECGDRWNAISFSPVTP